MTGFIASMLRFRALVVALAAGLLVAGVAELRKAPVDVLPEYSQPSVQVQTEALGLSAAEVEHDPLVVGRPGQLHRQIAALGRVDHVPLPLQAQRECPDEFGVVLDEQEAHLGMVHEV